jgi:polyferredoxin
MAPSPVPLLVGIAFAVSVVILASLLLWKGRMVFAARIIAWTAAALLGFLLFAPMFPYQIQQVALGNTAQLPMPVPIVLVIIAVMMLTALFVGRAFCGYACPVGGVQEIVYRAPTKKLMLRSTRWPFALRVVALASLLVLAVGFGLSFLGELGMKEFFALNFGSLVGFAFLAIVGAALFVYRPFCRFLCPFGALQSPLSHRPVLSLRRTESCINCGKCERVCPTNQAKRSSSRMDCFLCLRCVDSCPKGAIVYSRSTKEK